MSFLKKVGGLVLGAVGGAIGFVVGGPAGAAIGFSIGMGIGSAAQMAAMNAKVPDISSATSGRLNVSIDPDANRKIAFGETALGTDQVYWEAWGPENSFFDQVIAAAGHQIESFGDLYFDDELIPFSGDFATGAYAGALSKDDRTIGAPGSALQAGAGTLWNSHATFTSCAHYALKIKWSQEKYPRGIPSRITRIGKGALVYDPRRDSTVPGGSGSHRADVQSTWEYAPLDSNGQPIGRNPALQILWYEIGYRAKNPVTNEWILTCGRGRPLDDIDMAAFITAANDCEDEGYYSDCLLSTGDAHETNIAVLEAACAGKLMDSGGRIGLRIRTDTTGDIVQTFTDSDVLDTDVAEWIPSQPLSERWNQGVGSFVDPSALYKLVPLPIVRDTTYEAEDGFKRPGPTFRFDAVQDSDQAQKLIRLEMNMTRFQGVFTAPFNWRAKKVRVWDCVKLTFPRLGFTNKIFRVMEKKTDPMGAIWLLLREDDPSIYTPGTVTPLPAPGAGAGYDPRVVTPPDPDDWTVTPTYIEGGGARLPTFRITGGDTASTIVATHVSFRQGLTGDWVSHGRFTTGQSFNTDQANVVPGATYYFQLAYENTYGVRSSPTTLGPYTAPSELVVLSSLIADSFEGQGALATADQVLWASQVTGTGKPENDATKSRVFRQSATPTSPNTNDIWVVLSGSTPVAVRAWNGSAWITGADPTGINISAGFTGQNWGATAAEADASNAVPRAEAQRSNLIPAQYQLFGRKETDEGLPFRIIGGVVGATGVDNPFLGRDAAAFTTDGTQAFVFFSLARDAFTPNMVLPPGRYGYKIAIQADSSFTSMQVRLRNAAAVVVKTNSHPKPAVTGFTVVEGVFDLSAEAQSDYYLEIGVILGSAASGNTVRPYRFQIEPIPAAATGPGDWTGSNPKLAGIDDGADVTGDNTASAIDGQGVFATGNYYEQATDPGDVSNGSFWYKTGTSELLIRRLGSWALVSNVTVGVLSLSLSPSSIVTFAASQNCTGTASGGAGGNVFAWTKVSGDTLLTAGASSAVATFTRPGSVGASAVYRLTVTDSAGASVYQDLSVNFLV